MDRQKRWSIERVVVLGAVAAGLAAGTYGVAGAATGSGSSGSPSAVAASTPAAAPSARQPWGRQRSDETPVTGDALAKVRQLALAKVPGGTVIRVETDADGNAAYEVVYVSKQYQVVGVDSGMPGPRQAPPSSNGASA